MTLPTLNPTNMTEAMEFSKFLASSTHIPKDFQGNPNNILVAIQWGYEIGLAPMQALQNIAVINGRPSLWGDSMRHILIGEVSVRLISRKKIKQYAWLKEMCMVR